MGEDTLDELMDDTTGRLHHDVIAAIKASDMSDRDKALACDAIFFGTMAKLHERRVIRGVKLHDLNLLEKRTRKAKDKGTFSAGSRWQRELRALRREFGLGRKPGRPRKTPL